MGLACIEVGWLTAERQPHGEWQRPNLGEATGEVVEAWGAHPCQGFDFVRPAGAMSRRSAWKCVPLGDLVGLGWGRRLLDGRAMGRRRRSSSQRGRATDTAEARDLEHTWGWDGDASCVVWCVCVSVCSVRRLSSQWPRKCASQTQGGLNLAPAACLLGIPDPLS